MVLLYGEVMLEIDALAKMVYPSHKRKLPQQFNGGVIQIWVTRACDKACFGCTQNSQLRGYTPAITVEQFEQAVLSLKDYFGVVGVFGGNPALHPQFPELCRILDKHIPWERRGLWCNRLFGHGKIVRQTFNPRVSNINVHLDKEAADEFRRDWPEVYINGEHTDSRHSPPYVAMQDVVPDEFDRWDLITNCDINRTWSAMIGVFREELRAWFCEIAGAQSIIHQNNLSYPDTGLPLWIDNQPWWQMPEHWFAEQVRKHCHECGVPLRGFGELSQTGETERVSKTHQTDFVTKTKGRTVTLVTEISQINQGRITRVVDYIGNGSRK